MLEATMTYYQYDTIQHNTLIPHKIPEYLDTSIPSMPQRNTMQRSATRKPKTYPQPRPQGLPRWEKAQRNMGKQRIAWRQELGGGDKILDAGPDQTRPGQARPDQSKGQKHTAWRQELGG